MQPLPPFWGYLCDVEVAPLSAWLASGAAPWPPVKGGQPNRVQVPVEGIDAIHTVLRWFGSMVTYEHYYACLSRLVPGSTYEYHRDPQRPGWLTRVHVPIQTNPGAWLAFEGEGGQPVHFEAGKAYAFNTLERHRYGNDGDADRIHLLFDVYRG